MTLLFGSILLAFLNFNSVERLPDGTNLDKLAYSVAMAETGDCTAGTGLSNNCFGIKKNGRFTTYASKEQSYQDFKRIWKKYYGRYPTLEDAKRYTAGTGKEWLATVDFYYEK